MAFRRVITKRLIDGYRFDGTRNTIAKQLSSPFAPKILCQYMTSPNVTDQIIGIRIESVDLHGREDVREEAMAVKGLSVSETKKLLRIYQTEKVKARLREIPKSSVSYWEFVQICCESCGNNDEQGSQMAKSLDHSGCVVVLGDIVFLHPHQIAKSMEAIIKQTSAFPNDPRKEELVQLEIIKKCIDIKARRIVKTELYCGLGFLAAQTIGLMRLTFWELSWDVMEPICFFVTSLHFLLGYFFFFELRENHLSKDFINKGLRPNRRNLWRAMGLIY